MAGLRERHKSVKINTSFHSCPRHPVFSANPQAWFRSPSYVYHCTMCFGIPWLIIYISTKELFPWGQTVCVAVHGTGPGIWFSLNKYCYHEEWRNTGSPWVHQLSDLGNSSVLRGPMTPCLFPVLPDGATSSSVHCEHIWVVRNWNPTPREGHGTEAYSSQHTLCSAKFPLCSPWEWLP